MTINMTAPVEAPTSAAALFQAITGHYVSTAVNIAAALGVADAIGDAVRPYDEVAQTTGAHAESLLRLLRLLATAGVVTEPASGQFGLTELGRHLRTDVPDSLHAVALLHAGQGHQRRMFALAERVRTGPPPAEPTPAANPFAQMPPEVLAVFQQAMSFFTTQAAAAVVAAYDFGRFRTLVDIGGGDGTMLAAVLRATPGLRGILYDMPPVADAARERLREAGLGDRCESVGGDFFTQVPTGADAYLLKSVVHDWDDDQAVSLLSRCREAMAADGAVLIVETPLPERFDDSFASRLAAVSDISMMLGGGAERTVEQYTRLLAAAGLRFNRVVPVRPGWTGVAAPGLIEAVPA